MTSGEKMLAIAEEHIGEKYVNVCVPKNNPNWRGPWDCAEFMSWLVYQVEGKLYGCFDNDGDPALTEAYTGAWETDSKRLGKRIPWKDAASTVGAILLRYPPAPGTMGHIAVSDGKGGTVEAMGKAYGVKRGKAAGRSWNTGVLIPGFTYQDTSSALVLSESVVLYGKGEPNMDTKTVKQIQKSLFDLGFDPGPIDGSYGANTAAAVAAFQATKGLIVDGQVGLKTAKRLGVDIKG